MAEREKKQGRENIEARGSDSQLSSRESLGPPLDVIVFNLGGSWDMTLREGRRVGSGVLDDDELRRMQQVVGIFSARNKVDQVLATKRLANLLQRRFQAAQLEPLDAAGHLGSWCRDDATGETFGTFAGGEFISLFNGDSSHHRISLAAPMVSTLLERARKEPTKPLLGGQGTDTADLTILNLWDALTFDTQLPPLILTGADTPHKLPGSDAPRNFIDLARVTHADLRSGAYWVFHGNLYQAADLVKFTPSENRELENQSTFFAPHQTVRSIDSLLASGRLSNRQYGQVPPPEHVVSQLTAEELHEAFDSVYVFDLGNQNAGWMDMERIFDESVKAIVVAAHGPGNVDNETRIHLIRAAKQGKMVVDTSRTLVGVTDESYESSLLSANQNPEELGGTGKQIISGHKLNKATARALVTRALLEGLDQQETQELFDKYAQSRSMV